MSDYKEGPADQPWECIEDEQDGDSYVLRRGYDARNNRDERMYWVSDANDAQHLANELNRLDALSAWECADCGARFASIVPPELLKGVTHCTSCVKVRILTARCNRTRAALERLCAAVEATWTVMDTTPDEVRNRLYLASYEATQQAREVLNG